MMEVGKMIISINENRTKHIVIPQDYSKELAEETGIHIGDGFMNIYEKSNSMAYVYSGHAIDDLEFSKHVKNLMKKLYDLDPSYEKNRKDNTIILSYNRKKLIKFKHSIGLPMGKKDNIQIPEWIMKDREFKTACLSGIFSTDGSLHFQKKYRDYHYYPHLNIASNSGPLIHQIKTILNELEITSSLVFEKARNDQRRPNPRWSIHIYGVKNLHNFVSKVGLTNPKNQRKYKEWKNMPRA